LPPPVVPAAEFEVLDRSGGRPIEGDM